MMPIKAEACRLLPSSTPFWRPLLSARACSVLYFDWRCGTHCGIRSSGAHLHVPQTESLWAGAFLCGGPPWHVPARPTDTGGGSRLRNVPVPGTSLPSPVQPHHLTPVCRWFPPKEMLQGLAGRRGIVLFGLAYVWGEPWGVTDRRFAQPTFQVHI